MDSIRIFLENMFYGITPSPAVMRAKEEILAMMEDKYNELKAQGSTENEAVGQVIAEFGNLDELADSLGIRQDLAGSGRGENTEETLPTLYVKRHEADEFLTFKNRFGVRLAIGIMLTILAPAFMIAVAGYNEMNGRGDSDIAMLPGIIGLFAMIGLAVIIFVVSGVRSENFEHYEKKHIVLDSQTANYVQGMRDKERKSMALLLSAGFALIFIGVIQMMILGIYGEQNEALHYIAVVILLFLIALAVAFFVIGAVRKSALDQLLNTGSYTPEQQKSSSRLGHFAGPYWLLVVAVYLTWSFLTGNWGITWIVWPIAGVLFAIISSVVTSMNSSKK